MVVLFVLSSLGVNIAPLLAGDGVVGIALLALVPKNL